MFVIFDGYTTELTLMKSGKEKVHLGKDIDDILNPNSS